MKEEEFVEPSLVSLAVSTLIRGNARSPTAGAPACGSNSADNPGRQATSPKNAGRSASSETDQPGRVNDKAGSKEMTDEERPGLARTPGSKRCASGDLAPPAQAILLLAVLELFEIKRCRVLHEANAGVIAVKLREQAIDEVLARPRRSDATARTHSSAMRPPRRVEPSTREPVC